MRRRALIALLLWAPAAWAHGMRSGYLEVTEVQPGHALARWETMVEAPAVHPRFPATCHAALTGTALLQRTWQLECPGSLAGAPFSIEGLGPLISEAVVFVTLADGTTTSHLVTTAAPSWELPRVRAPLSVSAEYIGLGFRHVLSGADHVLFLILLVLLLRKPRPVILAETAFTLSHTLSFSATSLGWIRVSSHAAEACIALSLLLLALDVERRGVTAVSTWRAAGLALVFGLVHGLGFAGGLEELGVPAHAAAYALVGFGLGVELGQLLVLAVALIVVRLLLPLRHYRVIALAGTYAAGATATCWFIQRALLCLPGS